MGDTVTWQQLVIGLAAVLFIGGMNVVVWRYFARRSPGRSQARPGTSVESSLYGAEAPAGALVFDGFSYRVSARFAGRARVITDGRRVSFTGPRGPRGLYVFWIWLQAVLMAAAPVAFVGSLVTLQWLPALWGLGLLVGSTLVMAVGAGVWPGLGEVSGLMDGRMPTLEFSASDTRDVTIGHGWSNGGLAIVLLPYVAGIDRLAAGRAVSWWGPDEDGREVRFAFHCYDEGQARQLYDHLRASSQPQ